MYTQNYVVIPEMMLCVHTKSGYDSRDDVMCTQNHVVIPEMMLCRLTKSGYDSRDEVICTYKIML